MSYPHNDDCTGVHTILTITRTYNGGIKPGWTDATQHRWCGDPAYVRRTLINDRGWPRDLTKHRVIEGGGQRVEVVEVATLDIDQPDLFEEPV